MLTYKAENKELNKKLAMEQVKVKNRDELIFNQAEANKELRQDCEDFTEAYKKIQKLMQENDYNNLQDFKNKINTILTDCNLNKYRV